MAEVKLAVFQNQPATPGHRATKESSEFWQAHHRLDSDQSLTLVSLRDGLFLLLYSSGSPDNVVL